MKVVLLYPYPVEPDGQSLQGHYLLKGLTEHGVEAIPCDREDNFQKEWTYKNFKPDVSIGVGFWGDTPELILDPQRYGSLPVPWLNADGWVANYHEVFNKLPLILATSSWVKETYIRDGIDADRIEVAHIGYDPKEFYPRKKDDPAVLKIREMLGIEPDEKMILTMGGDVTSKGAQEMFKALAKVDKEFPKWKYVCKVWGSFSSDNHGKEERKLIKELKLKKDKITYLTGKFTPEFIAVLINACDIYAAPSRLEGFGMIQLEAQACGKPVISINVGGPKDVVVHNKTGFLVDVAEEIKLEKEWVYPWMGFEEKKQIDFPKPKTFAYRANTDQLAEYTLKLLKDDELREKMGNEAAKHAVKNFSYKVTSKHILDLIKKKVLKE